MNLILEILDWAKGKDLSEIYYQDSKSSSPTIVHLTFASNGSVPSKASARLAYIHAPVIGKVAYLTENIQTGQALQAGDRIGFVETDSEKTEICCLVKGKILEILVANGGAVGFGQPMVVLEVEG